MPASHAPTAGAELRRLHAAAKAWRQRSDHDLAELAAACRRSLEATADEWAVASVRAKQWQHQPHALAEEWGSGPLPVARFLLLLERLHRQLATGRMPPLHAGPSADPNRRSLSALPTLGWADRLLLPGVSAHIDVAADASQQQPERHGDTALVLGAGNVTATPVLDVLDQVFGHGRAVLLKTSPLHDDLVEIFGRALQPLRDAGLVALCTGDGEVGHTLARHHDTAAVHLTGSSATWAQLCADPKLDHKQLTAEVGCCTPVLIVPGVWRERDLRAAATQIAAYVATNGGATCVAPRLLLTARSWPQRRAFLHHVATALAQMPAREPFHPGAHAAYATALGTESDTAALQPALRADIDAEDDGALFGTELFAPALLELALDGDDADTWLTTATDFASQRVFGALSVYLFAAPRLRRRHRAAIDAASAALPYGTVAINCWTGLGYGLGNTPWGVPADAAIEHGRGSTRGTLCLPADRAIIEAPLRPIPLPPWLPHHRRSAPTLRALTRFFAAPSALRLAHVAALALQHP